MFKDPETGQRVLLVFSDNPHQSGSQQKTTTLVQTRIPDAQPFGGEPTFPEHYSEEADILPPQYHSQEQPNSSPPANDPFQDQDALEGLRAGFQ